MGIASDAELHRGPGRAERRSAEPVRDPFPYWIDFTRLDRFPKVSADSLCWIDC